MLIEYYYCRYEQHKFIKFRITKYEAYRDVNTS